MSKQVLILSASPRKNGNSDTLSSQFLKGALESGHQAEKIFLRDKKINYCIGCTACYKTHQCVQTDDMAEILDKMLAADVIVMATPVYFYTMSAQLKTLIDRTMPCYSQMGNKDIYYIVSAADTDQTHLERAIDALRGFSEACLDGSSEKGVLYATGVWKPGTVKDSPIMQQAYEMGKSV